MNDYVECRDCWYRESAACHRWHSRGPGTPSPGYWRVADVEIRYQRSLHVYLAVHLKTLTAHAKTERLRRLDSPPVRPHCHKICSTGCRTV